jgi:hypothetical protein
MEGSVPTVNTRVSMEALSQYDRQSTRFLISLYFGISL